MMSNLSGSLIIRPASRDRTLLALTTQFTTDPAKTSPMVSGDWDLVAEVDGLRPLFLRVSDAL